MMAEIRTESLSAACPGRNQDRVALRSLSRPNRIVLVHGHEDIHGDEDRAVEGSPGLGHDGHDLAGHVLMLVGHRGLVRPAMHRDDFRPQFHIEAFRNRRANDSRHVILGQGLVCMIVGAALRRMRRHVLGELHELLVREGPGRALLHLDAAILAFRILTSAKLAEHLAGGADDRKSTVGIAARLGDGVDHSELAGEFTIVEFAIDRERHDPWFDTQVEHRAQHQAEGRAFLRSDDRPVALGAPLVALFRLGDEKPERGHHAGADGDGQGGQGGGEKPQAQVAQTDTEQIHDAFLRSARSI
ncbi:MAG: hypothetical protein ACYTG5_09765 [Planctomycetota bacterium]